MNQALYDLERLVEFAHQHGFNVGYNPIESVSATIAERDATIERLRTEIEWYGDRLRGIRALADGGDLWRAQ